MAGGVSWGDDGMLSQKDLSRMRVAGRASDPSTAPPSGRKPKPFAASDAGGVAAALSTDDHGRASQHGRKTGRENPRFQPPSDPDTKPHSAHHGSGGVTRSAGSTASVGNTAHMKNLERSWNAELAQEDRSGAARTSEPNVYKSGYSVDLMSTRELMELRRGIEASLDKRGVEPASTVTYDWHTDAGEAGTVTARIAKERPRSAGPARSRPEWMGLEARRPQTARATKNGKNGLRPSSPFGLQRAGPPVPVPAYSRDAQRNIAVHAAKLHRPPTKMVEPPPAPRAGAFRARKPAQTNFSRRYRCGDLPVSVDHGHSKPAIRWLVEPQRLDLHYYLPLFFDGLRETRFPESMLARQGVVTLVEMGGTDCVPIVGKLIQPIKAALNTRDPSTIILTLNTICKLVRTVRGRDGSYLFGTALLPYYKTILPLINGFKNRSSASSGDQMDFGNGTDLQTTIAHFLDTLRETGGKAAFAKIKSVIPTYECL